MQIRSSASIRYCLTCLLILRSFVQVEDQGFIDTLNELLGDSNPMVVSNCIAALAEITTSSGKPVYTLNRYAFAAVLCESQGTKSVRACSAEIYARARLFHCL